MAKKESETCNHQYNVCKSHPELYFRDRTEGNSLNYRCRNEFGMTINSGFNTFAGINQSSIRNPLDVHFFEVFMFFLVGENLFRMIAAGAEPDDRFVAVMLRIEDFR